jgi:cytoskeletal protein RodZ
MKFVRRELPNDTLGEALKSVREDAGFSIQALAEAAGVQAKYIEALEQGRYDLTPGPVYIRGFLRSISETLELSADTVIARFNAEPHGHAPTAKSAATGFTRQQVANRQSKRWVAFKFDYRSTRFIIIGAIIFAALVYFSISITKMLLPPQLVISDPAGDVIVNQPQINFAGQTEPEVSLEVNGRLVQVDEHGNFKETIDLQEGVNTLTITARKKRSRPITLTRRILVQLPNVVQ